jgi:hypothetical protein
MLYDQLQQFFVAVPGQLVTHAGLQLVAAALNFDKVIHDASAGRTRSIAQ